MNSSIVEYDSLGLACFPLYLLPNESSLADKLYVNGDLSRHYLEMVIGIPTWETSVTVT
jgi:hypothetical protein